MSYFKHGLTGTKTYSAWHATRLRGRVAAWDVFETFLADMGTQPENTRLARFDTSLPYGPDNTEWALAGAKDHPLHGVWKGMLQRCYNSNVKSYKDYGARGIIVCLEWRRSFTQFALDMGERPDGYSIERDDSDGNYEPANCRWASTSEQHENRRISRKWVRAADGVAHTTKGWIKELGLIELPRERHKRGRFTRDDSGEVLFIGQWFANEGLVNDSDAQIQVYRGG